jgi:hypothetical protein
MNKQNAMMDFIWLLNAVDNSAFETKGLYIEFLRQQQEFQQIRRSVPANTPQSDYMEREIRRNLDNLENTQKIIQEVINILRLSETERINDE